MPLRMLIVDDNVELAENLAEIFEDAGVEVAVAGDPQEALRVAHGLCFDAALLDVRMPGMDGVDLHARLLETRPKAMYFLMTAYTSDQRLAVARDAGIRTIFPKPFDPDELLDRLNRWSSSP